MTGGTVKSEPGFSPAINAEFVGTGNDYIHNDPSGKHMRLNAHGVVKDSESGAMVYLNYSGVVDITPEVGAILQGHQDAKSTDFGNSCEWYPAVLLPPLESCTVGHLLTTNAEDVVIEMRFETGSEKLKALETGTFVAAGRFIYEHGKPVVVEYKVSNVVKGSN